ncbi:50S ribosomal protein L9 [bacterium]|nr:50S ribosomal protein L9 [bacterium]
MRLLLRRTLENVGKIGDVVNVSDGYGRNYLLPQGLAVAVTPDNKRLIEFEKVEVAKQEAAKKSAAETLARSIEGLELTIQVKAQDDGSLYGSVTPHQIVDALKAARGDFPVDTKMLKIADPIRKLGDFKIEVKLHSEVLAGIGIKVLREPE